MAYTLADLLAGDVGPSAPIDRDQALTVLRRAKRQLRRRGEVIRQLHAGELADDDLGGALLRRVAAGFAPVDADGRDALLALLMHVDREAPDLLSTAWGSERLGPRPGNTLVDGLCALARHHHRWQSSPDNWKPAERDERAQFASLAVHLLARYEVPAFLHGAWFDGDDHGRRHQDWFVLVGTGGNLRTASDLPLTLTRRMAHHVLQAPAGCTVVQALRYGQVLGFDGSPDLAAAVNSTRLGRSFDNEEFWCTVVRFLARCDGHIDPDLVGFTIGYLRHQRFVPQETVGADGKRAGRPSSRICR
jgi:hypothetical protein